MTQAHKKARKPKAHKRLAIAATLGTLAGLGCTFLPPHYQVVCLAAVKLVTLLTGG